MGIATWVGYPRSYSKGRSRPVQYVVVHYTAGSEGPTSAEAGHAYDVVRTDGTSTHCFADSNSVVREVPDGDRAHHARAHGNEIGLGLELCGTAQTRAQWLDEVSSATLRLAAKQTAEWCRDHGLPVRRLSVAQTRAAYYNPAGQRPKGIVGHVDCTEAYPEDGGTHTDPGAQFPWDVFIAMVGEELANLTQPSPEEDHMAKPKFIVVTSGGTEQVCITGGMPTLGYRHLVDWAQVLYCSAEWGLPANKADVLAWPRMVPEEATARFGSPEATDGGGLTFDQAVEAARQGAELAEDS